MSRDLKINRRAHLDIVRIARWLHDLSPRGALSWRNALWRTVFRIVEDAESFALADESPKLTRPVRDAVFKTRRGRLYRIIFRFTEEHVIILRVRGPGQRPLRQRDLPPR